MHTHEDFAWLRDRPLTLVRAPDGVGKHRYYQKAAPTYAPDWIATVRIPAPSAGRDVDYVVCQDAPTLRWLGNQAVVEFHPAPVRRDRLERPDLLVVDVDPPEDGFEAAVEVVFLVLEILEDRHGCRSTIVTSQVPVENWHDYIAHPTIADAVLDRLVHNAHKIRMKGPSRRKETAQTAA